MKIVKLLALLFALCLALSLLVACDSGDTPKNDEPKTPAECDHTWTDATCESPKTCSKCSKTEGSAAGHTWTDATCESPKTCSKCSKTEGSTLSEHNYQDGKCTYCGQEDPKEAQYAAAGQAFAALKEANDLCTQAMGSIYDTWYFTVYESNDYSYTRAQSCLRALCSYADIEQEDFLTAWEAALGSRPEDDFDLYVGLITIGVTVPLACDIMELNGVFPRIRECLEIAKEKIKTLTNEYSDYTGFSTLKDYYTEISAYFEFCQSPTGSFAQLKGTVEQYESNLRKYKNDLGFIFD